MGERSGNSALVFLVQVAGAEFVRVNFGVGGKQAEQERFLGHFQAENRDGLVSAHAHIFREVQRERRFPHRRPRRQNHQFGRLQARGQVVEHVVTGGEARDAMASLVNPGDAVVAFGDDVVQSDEAQAHAIFGQLKDRGLGAVQDRIGVVLGFEGLLLDRARRMDQAAQQRFLLHDARVVLDVGDVRHAVHQLRDVRRAADRFQFAAALQLLGERHEIDRLLRFAERDHLLINAAVMIVEKILRLELLDGGIDGVVVEQDRAEDAALGLDVVGQGTFERCACSGHK